MLDRLTNLLVLFTLAAALVVLAMSLHTAWNTTAPWEKEWVAKPGTQPSHTAEEVLTAIRNATAAHSYEDELPSVFRLPTDGFHATCFSIC